MASPSSQGRKRTPGKTSTEDQALNVIASEAEARLAAKRAARAEARVIRMKELERAQQEADEKMDREYQRSLITDEPLKQRASRVSEKIIQSRTTPTVEVEMNGPLSQESQLRTLQENIREVNEKYKKAMVSNAQLDNEKQALAYQVDCLKDRLEEAEEEVENLKQEINDKTRELNRVKYENTTHMEELEKAREQLILRDKLLEEHGIPTDGSEQPDISQSEISSRLNDSMHLDVDYDLSATGRNDANRRPSGPDDRDALLEQIKALKDEVSDLRRNPDYEDERLRNIESLQNSDDQNDLSSTNAAQDFEKSETFEDVTDEAREIHDRLRGGLIVNNNERNEEFDVIDQNLRQGQLSNFEDKSFECSTGFSASVNESATDSDVDSNRFNMISDSMESDKPLEISITAGPDKADENRNLEEGSQTDSKRQQDLVDYDIVEASGMPTKICDHQENCELAGEIVPELELGNSNEVIVAEEASGGIDIDEKQASLDMIDVTAESQALFARDTFSDIISANEAAGSDIVEIELPGVATGGVDYTYETSLRHDVAEDAREEADVREDVDECFPNENKRKLMEEADDVLNVNGEEPEGIKPLGEDEGVLDNDDEIEQKNSKDDDDGFDNIESDEIFVDARSELSEEDNHSSFDQNEKYEEASEVDVEHFEEVNLPTDASSDQVIDQLVNVTDKDIFSEINEAKLDNVESFVSENDDGDKMIEISANETKTLEGPAQIDQSSENWVVEVSAESELTNKGNPDYSSSPGEVDIKSVPMEDGSSFNLPSSTVDVAKLDGQMESKIEDAAQFDEVSENTKDSVVSDVNIDSDTIDISFEDRNPDVVAGVEQSLPDIDVAIEESSERIICDIEQMDASEKLQVVENEAENENEGRMNDDAVGVETIPITTSKDEEIHVIGEIKESSNTNTDLFQTNAALCNTDADIENKDSRAKETSIDSDQDAAVCENETHGAEISERTDDESRDIDVTSNDKVEEVPLRTLDGAANSPVATVGDVQIQHEDSGDNSFMEDAVSEKGSREDFTTGNVTDVTAKEDVVQQWKAIHIPDADYPINDDDNDGDVNDNGDDKAGESLSNVEEGQNHPRSEDETITSHPNSGSGEDQLITAFETRTRLGSHSPATKEKNLSLPVPKERKKKKKKDKKGTVKMLVQELIPKSSDSESSGIEATADTGRIPDRPGEACEDEKEQIVEGGYTDHLKGAGLEEGRRQELDEATKMSEPKGLNSESEAEGRLSKDHSFDSQDDTILIKDPVNLENSNIGSNSEASHADATAKGKGKEKNKSKKESKKDGCKSQ